MAAGEAEVFGEDEGRIAAASVVRAEWDGVGIAMSKQDDPQPWPRLLIDEVRTVLNCEISRPELRSSSSFPIGSDHILPAARGTTRSIPGCDASWSAVPLEDAWSWHQASQQELMHGYGRRGYVMHFPFGDCLVESWRGWPHVNVADVAAVDCWGMNAESLTFHDVRVPYFPDGKRRRARATRWFDCGVWLTERMFRYEDESPFIRATWTNDLRERASAFLIYADYLDCEWQLPRCATFMRRMAEYAALERTVAG